MRAYSLLAAILGAASFQPPLPSFRGRAVGQSEPVQRGQSGDKLARMADEKRVGIRRNSSYGAGLRNHLNNKPSKGRV